MKVSNTEELSYFFLVTDATLVSDNPSRFRNNVLENMINLIMTIDMVRDRKLQYDINAEATKISELSHEKMIIMQFSQVKKYYLLIKE